MIYFTYCVCLLLCVCVCVSISVCLCKLFLFRTAKKVLPTFLLAILSALLTLSIIKSDICSCLHCLRCLSCLWRIYFIYISFLYVFGSLLFYKNCTDSIWRNEPVNKRYKSIEFHIKFTSCIHSLSFILKLNWTKKKNTILWKKYKKNIEKA